LLVDLLLLADDVAARVLLLRLRRLDPGIVAHAGTVVLDRRLGLAHPAAAGARVGLRVHLGLIGALGALGLLLDVDAVLVLLDFGLALIGARGGRQQSDTGDGASDSHHGSYLRR